MLLRGRDPVSLVTVVMYPTRKVPRPPIHEPDSPTVEMDMCVAGVLLSGIPRFLQWVLCQELRREQCRRQVLEEHRHRTKVMLVEEVARREDLEIYKHAVRDMQMLVNSISDYIAEGERVQFPPEPEDYDRNSWGLKVTNVPPYKSCVPLGRVLP